MTVLGVPVETTTVESRLTPTPDAIPMGIGHVVGSMGDSKAPTRSCARLLSVTKMPALDRAKRRKAILREGETNNPRNLARKWSSKKVAAKSARYGVKLTEFEAEEPHKFILLG